MDPVVSVLLVLVVVAVAALEVELVVVGVVAVVVEDVGRRVAAGHAADRRHDGSGQTCGGCGRTGETHREAARRC